MEKLKPCPFCGHNVIIDTMTIISSHGLRKTVPIIVCQCGGIMLGLSEQEAIEAWNRRASDGT